MSNDAGERPWVSLYSPGLDPEPTLQHGSIIEAWDARVAGNPDRIALRYFDVAMTARELDQAADALATVLQTKGVAPKDRVALYLQNVPAYPVALLALWKIGAIAVPLNPMYYGRELRRLIDDAEVTGIIAENPSDLAEALDGSTVRWSMSTAEVAELTDGKPDYKPAKPDDTAFITYTSGTTGPPKGALNSHGNFLSSASNYASWVNLQPGDVVLAIAPLFHITGLTLNAGISLFTDTTLVLAGRYQPEVIVDAIERHGVTFTIGAITAFNAMLALESAHAGQFASVKHFYSGGAPIPPATIAAFRDRFGVYLHNIWGMTESTAGAVAVPRDVEAPIHQPSGMLSVGIPMQNVVARVVNPDGNDVEPGQEGELELQAPQVISGYWRNAEATAHTFPGGRLRTGDVAVMDARGWIYLVDRLKDQINASGYKVWPREVEDVLYEHPAVFEAAVVGEPDPYRGETVVAYVSLAAGATASPDELIEFTRQRLAAYKYPRKVYIVDEIPKTATGKIKRNSVRDAGA